MWSSSLYIVKSQRYSLQKTVENPLYIQTAFTVEEKLIHDPYFIHDVVQNSEYQTEQSKTYLNVFSNVKH